MTKCCGIMGLIFGHKFIPIITNGISQCDLSGTKCKSHVALDMAEKYREQTFHGCICKRCGCVSGEQS